VFVTRTQIRESVPWIAQIQWAGLPMLFILAGVLIAITVIDIEHMIIPDSLSLGLFGVIVLSMLLGNISIFGYLFAGFLSASLLLLLNFATKGKGMGLGDVKLALPLGAILGIQYVFPWFVVSFVLGGIYGMAVLLAKQAKLRDKVPFGPFLVLGFFIILIFGQQIKILFPFPIL
jgi:prepilin signal peptidase PulO-like enzyme (type II secretory pathway)